MSPRDVWLIKWSEKFSLRLPEQMNTDSDNNPFYKHKMVYKDYICGLIFKYNLAWVLYYDKHVLTFI